MMDNEPLHIKYDVLIKAMNYLRNEIENSKEEPIQRIVGISRGGLIPAVHLSHDTDIPMTPVSYSSKEGNGDNKNHDNVLPEIEETRILLVDDIADYGHTLNELKDHYNMQGHNVQTCAVVAKDHSVIIPDYTWKILPSESGWVIFPWE
jgi:xanthine phosphoribosyltransferase